MKVKLLSALFLIVCQFSFSQTEKLLKGVVSSENFLLQNVDVINKTSKKGTTTNEKGEFIIGAKANDSLVFYAKEFHLQNIKLTSHQIDQNNLEVLMFKKPEELEEVVITKIAPIKVKWDEKWEREKRDEAALDMAASAVKNRDVYNGKIENGMNFMRMGRDLLRLFSKEKDKKEALQEIEFAVLAKNICDQKFFLENLKLKPDQIDLFLQFCDSDPKSKTLIGHHNVLSMMDFLFAKNIEFQKLNSFEK